MLKEKELEVLKNQLLKRKQELLAQIDSSQTIIEDLLCETAYDDTDYAEISSDSYNLNILKNKQTQELKEIETVLKKIANKTYGICEMCGEKIGLKRLKIKPHARFCVDCRPIYEKSLKNN